MKDLSIILPAFQKGRVLEKVLNLLFDSFKEAEIIVIDDNSSDNTLEIVKNIQNNFLNLKYFKNEKNYGKGYSLKKGILMASRKYVIFTDADLPYGLEGIEKIYQKLKEGSKIVIGKRVKYFKDPFLRKITRPILYFSLKLILKLKYQDTQCGLKGFSQEIAQKIFSLSFINRFAIDIEILYLASLLKIPVEEIEVEIKNFDKSSTFHLKDFFQMFFDILKIKFHHYEIQDIEFR